jgi:poly(A) polymerase
LKDIQDRIIRTIGDPEKRFQEDRLRLMRAVRFAARFGFSIEKATFEALKKKSETILSVSFERIRDELIKMLMNKKPDQGIRLLLETGILKAVLPEIVALIGVKQPDTFHPEGDVFDHTMKILRLMDEDKTLVRSETLALAALLHDIGKPRTYYDARDRIRFHNHNVVGKAMSKEILRRLRFPGEIVEDVSFCVENHMNFMNAPKMRENTLKRFIRAATFPVELVLHRLDCLASHGDLSTHDFLKNKTEELGKEKISPPPLINGKKLIEMGYAPGPLFKKILTTVEDQQLLEKISTAGEAERFVKENYPL